MTQEEIQNFIAQYKSTLLIINNAVKNKLKEIGQTQAYKITGIHPTAISEFIHNKRSFAPKMLFKIAEKIF
jgi:plasmid maintenance system antidote protein VapI